MSAAAAAPRPSRREPRPLTGRHVLIMVLAFFGLVIGVDTAFTVLAYRSFSGQVAKDPYEAGLVFNRTLEQRRREAALGWSAEATVEGGTVRLRVLDRAGTPVAGLAFTGVLDRPATETGRQTLNFAPAGHGWYAAPARLDGAWDLRALATGRSGEAFEIEHRFVDR